MNKSILIIDTPKNCWECPLHTESFNEDYEDIMICNAAELESHYGKIPSYCPLKPMPNMFGEEYWEKFDDSNYKDPIRY